MVVTVSSSFGSGGSLVATGVAEQLGWPLHNRAIPAEVAERLSVDLEAALSHDESAESAFGRLISRLAVHLTSVEPVPDLPRIAALGGEEFRVASEAVIR